MDMYKNSDKGCFPDVRLVDFCNRFCLLNRINEPKRITKTSKSLIDVLLTSHPECYATSSWTERPLLNLYSAKKYEFKAKAALYLVRISDYYFESFLLPK